MGWASWHELSDADRRLHVDWVDSHYRWHFQGRGPRPSDVPPRGHHANEADLLTSKQVRGAYAITQNQLTDYMQRPRDPLRAVRSGNGLLFFAEETAEWFRRNKCR
jgi:hypothetical protein